MATNDDCDLAIKILTIVKTMIFTMAITRVLQTKTHFQVTHEQTEMAERASLLKTCYIQEGRSISNR